MDEESTCRKFRQVRQEGNREMTYYNIDMIISLGLSESTGIYCGKFGNNREGKSLGGADDSTKKVSI